MNEETPSFTRADSHSAGWDSPDPNERVARGYLTGP
jgi:hypothetical protein